MKNRSTSISHDDEIQEIFDEITRRNANKSAVMRELLQAYRDNGYQVPVVEKSKTVPDGEYLEVDETK